jgi:hypothetical protein
MAEFEEHVENVAVEDVYDSLIDALPYYDQKDE